MNTPIANTSSTPAGTEPTRPLDAAWPAWARWFAALMMPAMLICIILDRDADKVLTVLAWVLLTVMALADRHRSWRRLSAAVSATAMVIVVSTLIAFFTGDFREAVSNFLKYQVGILWLAISWLAIPLVTPSATAAGAARSPLMLCTGLLLCFAAWATFSAAGSLFPEESMDLLGSEILPYAGLFILIIRLVLPILPPATLTYYPIDKLTGISGRSLWLITVISSIAMAAIALLALASADLADAFLSTNLFRMDSDAPGTHRLQFLFHHHNRAGFFAACAIFLCLAGAFGRTGWRAIGIIGAIAAAVSLPFTLTRGALVAAAAGMAFFTVCGLLGYRRGRWALLAAFLVSIPLIWALLPENYQDHIAKITNIRNYREDAGGSIGARIIMWENAADMIDRRPVLGFGYGFENFVAAARHDHPNIPNYFQDAVHAHNQWLETGAETGLPGLVLLALFTSIRLLWLATTWWVSRREKHPLAWLLLLWLSLEITIQIYGLTNYTLRRNLGYLTYAIWAGSIALIMLTNGNKRTDLLPLPNQHLRID